MVRRHDDVVLRRAAALKFGHHACLIFVEVDGHLGVVARLEVRARVFVAHEYPDYGVLSPRSLGGSPVSIVLVVEDADALAHRAVAAGAKLLRPVEDQFYGDRTGKLEDPFGHVWHVQTHKEDMSAEEMQRRIPDLLVIHLGEAAEV